MSTPAALPLAPSSPAPALQLRSRFIGIAAMLLLSTATPIPAATVTIETSYRTPALGSTIDIVVRVADAGACQSWNVFLRFDPARFRLTGQRAAAVGQAGQLVADSRPLADINATGEVHAGGFTRTASTVDGIQGIFSFRPIATGPTTISSGAFTQTSVCGALLMRGQLRVVPALGPALTLDPGGVPVRRTIRMLNPPGWQWDCEPAPTQRRSADGSTILDGLVPSSAHRVFLQPSAPG